MLENRLTAVRVNRKAGESSARNWPPCIHNRMRGRGDGEAMRGEVGGVDAIEGFTHLYHISRTFFRLQEVLLLHKLLSVCAGNTAAATRLACTDRIICKATRDFRNKAYAYGIKKCFGQRHAVTRPTNSVFEDVSCKTSRRLGWIVLLALSYAKGD